MRVNRDGDFKLKVFHFWSKVYLHRVKLKSHKNKQKKSRPTTVHGVKWSNWNE